MKKTTVYITIAVVLLVLYFISKSKTKTEMENTPQVVNPSSNDLASAFLELKNKYGEAFAEKIEQLYRLETAHFKSGQFLEGNSPGMVATKTEYPFGWKSLDQYNKANSIDGRRYSVGRIFVVRGKNYRYVKFPDFKTALNFVAWFIKNKRGGAVEKWNSLDATAAARYLSKLNKIKTHYT